MFPRCPLVVLCLLAATVLHTAGCGNHGSQPNSATTTSPPSTPTSPTSGTPLAISSPVNGASVSSPFTLAASATICSSQTVTSIGYALDNGSTTVDSGTSLSTELTAAAGAHTVKVTAWGNEGATCTASVSVDVTAPAPSANSPVPSNAISVSSIEMLSGWQEQHDPATGATSSGTMSLVSSPALSGQSRQFNTTFTGSGGETYHISWGNDQSVQNFFYDGWVYLTDTAASIANLEVDMNQVVSDGDTIIYGVQCDGYSGTWDYTENAGSPSQPNDTWVHTGAACNVRNWSRNTWHHIQTSYSRDNSGNVTYHSIWLDGTESKINATVPSAFALGWASVLLTNFQIDGLGSGSNTVYLNQLTISRW
jgi:hypothetical protein